MALFDKYSLLRYDLENKDDRLIRNILVRVGIRRDVKNTEIASIIYDVNDGETPEMISYKIYGTVEYHWLIMMMNDIANLYCDWVKSTEHLNRYVEKKYGVGNFDAIHHYETPDGFVVNASQSGAIPITNFNFEFEENEKRRRIKILDPQYIDIVEDEIEKLLSANDR